MCGDKKLTKLIEDNNAKSPPVWELTWPEYKRLASSGKYMAKDFLGRLDYVKPKESEYALMVIGALLRGEDVPTKVRKQAIISKEAASLKESKEKQIADVLFRSESESNFIKRAFKSKSRFDAWLNETRLFIRKLDRF